MGEADYLRGMTDAELAALVAEMDDRPDAASAQTRAMVNDELRRRRLPPAQLRRRW